MRFLVPERAPDILAGAESLGALKGHCCTNSSLSLKPSELVCTIQRDPEINAVATRAIRICGRACAKVADRCQVGGLPQRHTSHIDVRHENSPAVERGLNGLIEAVSGECCEHNSIPHPNYCQGIAVIVRHPNVGSIEDREWGLLPTVTL